MHGSRREHSPHSTLSGSQSDVGELERNKRRPSTDIPKSSEAFLVVIGGFCSLFVSFGWINATGFFESYYQHDLFPTLSASTITWISSIGFSLLYLFAFPAGVLVKSFGSRPVLLAGSILHLIGLMAMSFSTQYYQLLLSQGVCSGLGSSAIFYAGVATVSTWFAKRQALAVGISAAGSSLGGIVFPAMVTELMPRIGFAWTARSATLIIAILLIIANLTIKDCPHPPQPPPPIHSNVRGGEGDSTPAGSKEQVPTTMPEMVKSAFRSPQFMLTMLGGVVFAFGYFVTLILLVTVATMRNFPNPVYALVTVNAASLPGRIVPGALADKLGHFNIMCVMTFVSAILSLGLYLPTETYSAFIAYCIVFGFTSASMVFLSPSLVIQVSHYEEAGIRIGILYSLVSLSALFGAPVGGALLAITTKGLGPGPESTAPGRWLLLFCGLCQALGCLVFVAARWSIAGWKMIRV